MENRQTKKEDFEFFAFFHFVFYQSTIRTRMILRVDINMY